MSGTNYYKNSSVPHVANLLTSILIHNPEIAKIKLDPRKQVVKISFYVKNISQKIKPLKEHLQQLLETYYYLSDIKVTVSSFEFQQLEYFTIIEFQRDVISFSEKEISLIIALLKEDFDATLVIDEDGLLLMDDPTLHEELVSYLLDNAKTGIELIALRDEGRVVVFNN
ncbi:MAG: hypothetical protein PHX16_01175 [Syntrophaceticus sp.]|nr:hypothetical protein [Syntrophaceticus sp.]MDD3313938.1 hypothetical protein [Syntrophaceticus sp.]MDD4359016.1 hypothetical protein [Syntrophaceticus sp.]MDD4782243.1 hypothetical protein [Syntrophaceticus sp.]